jgi:type 2 lantibiotic biosynthesis protein LanM
VTPRPAGLVANGEPEWLAAIAIRAASLWERLRDRFRGDATAVAAARWAQWSRIVGDGDDEKLRVRLRHAGLAPEAILPLLGDATPDEEWSPPAWLGILAEIAATAADDDDVAVSDTRPFAALLVPIVRVARRRLRNLVGRDDPAFRSLEASLAQTLLTLAAATLQLEFSIFRATHTSPLTRAKLQLTAAPARSIYDRFVRATKEDGFRALFTAYPVLGRRIARAVERWCVASAEVVGRLERDRAGIVERVLRGCDPGSVRAISGGWSDAHAGGRTVHVVSFENGARIVYKPKSLGVDVAFGEVLEWLGARVSCSLRHPRTLDRGDYGWVEFIEHVPCATQEELSRYYRRAGVLLAAVHALEGSDLHYENVIACGEHPVLVDVEMLFQAPPVRPATAAAEVENVVAAQLADTVFRTGLLPRWELQADGECIDVSGLGAVEKQAGGVRIDWQDVNTDRMTSVVRSAELQPAGNVPFADGGDPAAFVESIVDGFRDAWRAIVRGRDELPRLLARFDGLPVRFLVRSTSGYARLMQYSLRPEFLRDGAEHSILLDRVSRSFLTTDDSPFAPIVAAELDAIEDFDIPRFVATATGRDVLHDGRTTIADFFATTGAENVARRLQRLSEADLERQCGYIAASFATRRETQRHAANTRAAELPAPREVTDAVPERRALAPSCGRPAESPSLQAGELLGAAERIARRIIDSATMLPGGRPTWIAIRYSSEARRYELMPAGTSLYDGDGGIALFLDAWSRASGDERAAEMARSVARALVERVEHAAADPELSRIGIGIGVGWGSVVYTLLRLGFVADAERTALEFLTAERIAQSSTDDVLLGTAGALLSLLAVHDATANAEVLVRAIACGDRLLHSDCAQNGGIAHGAAGIALAMSRLGRATAEERFALFAREGMLAALDAPRTTGWCRGAAGIALASLSTRDSVDCSALMDATLAEISDVDHLCCGAAGRAAVLIAAGARLGRDDLRDAGCAALGALTGSATLRLSSDTRGFDWNPAFFQGLAGIGYEMLRAADRAPFPCILAFE